MNMQTLQALLVGGIVSISTIIALRHVAPGVFRVCQSSLARRLGRSRHSRLLRALGRRLQPLEAKQGGCGSGQGCSSCGGCGSPAATPVESIPLKFRSPPLQPR